MPLARPSRLVAPPNLRNQLRALDESVHFVQRPDLAPLVNWSGGRKLPVHRWFRYREGFSPKLIEALELGDSLLDPFCGSGSIMVGAAQLGRTSIGIDVNPLATFVAQTKLTPLTTGQLEAARQFLSSVSSDRWEPTDSWPAPPLKIAHKVFEPDVQEELLTLRASLEATASESPGLRNFLLLAWISILEDVGSYFKEGNGIKYRNRKRLKTGYIKRTEGEWQRERFGQDQRAFVRQRFAAALSAMLDDAAEWNTGSWQQQQVLTGNTIELTKTLPPDSVDSVVFSPPYANRFDYFESLKVELWFGGFVSSYADMVALRKQSLRSHLGASLSKHATAYEPLENLIEMIDRNSYAWRMRVPALLRGYFHDMWEVLVACRAALQPTGRCYIIVGNSAYGGTIIPTDVLLAQLGRAAGFEHAEVWPVRHLTVAPQQRSELEGMEDYMRESTVVLW